MDNLSRIIEFIRIRGPILPVQAAKEVGTNILMSGAMLSELSSKGKIKVSSLKVGSSPLYYIPGQEIKLQSFANYLGNQERKAYERLKAQKVMNDKELDPVTRTALRLIKDFAKPLQVTINSTSVMFWKWYLLPEDETSLIIKEKLGISLKQEKDAPKQEQNPEPEHKTKPVEVKPSDSSPIVQAIIIPSTDTAIPEKLISPLKRKASPLPEVKPKQPEKVAPEKQKQKAIKPVCNDEFMEALLRYFAKNSIEVLEKNLIRRNSEADFLISIPSAVGAIRYYCNAKNKKQLSEPDLSSVYGRSKLKKLPALLMTTGELTKKAKESAEKDYHEIKIINLQKRG